MDFKLDRVIKYIRNNLKIVLGTLIVLISLFYQRKMLIDRILLIIYAISGNERQITLNYVEKNDLELCEPWIKWLCRLLCW
ncbi:9852_t:CDS:2 [Rhizophagus irregularis]|nr:9852_t:CDS:2 [Rhizophagus irregularis]